MAKLLRQLRELRERLWGSPRTRKRTQGVQFELLVRLDARREWFFK